MRRWRSFKSCSLCIHGKACHTILRSLCSLTNRVPLPPLCRGQNKTPRDNLLINPPLKLTMAAAPLSSFRPKRSGVEKSHASMVRAALRQKISRLRVSSKRFPSAPYRHAAPLEMTMAAGSIQSFQKGANDKNTALIPVISTEAKRSGEISLLNSPGSMEAENLRLRVPIEPCIPARAPLQMTRGSPLLSWNQNKGIKKRSPLSRASSLFMKLDSIFFSEIRICSSGKQSRNRHPLHHCRVHQHRMHILHGAVRSSGGLR